VPAIRGFLDFFPVIFSGESSIVSAVITFKQKAMTYAMSGD
jgi:hypothetical protein